MRSADNHNSTIQDGEKHYLLCGECEDRFSEYEKKFADNIFHPYFNQKQRAFNYDQWLHYFITSVSWRHLYLDLLDFVQNDVVGLDALECLIESEQLMRVILLGKRAEIGNIEHHIFFFEDIDTISDELKELQPHVSIHRSICGYTAANEATKKYFTFTNMMGYLCLHFIIREKMKSGKTHKLLMVLGVSKQKTRELQVCVGKKITKIMENAERSQEQLSDRQQEKIKQRLQKAADKIEKYPIWDDFKKDRNYKKPGRGSRLCGHRARFSMCAGKGVTQ